MRPDIVLEVAHEVADEVADEVPKALQQVVAVEELKGEIRELIGMLSELAQQQQRQSQVLIMVVRLVQSCASDHASRGVLASSHEALKVDPRCERSAQRAKLFGVQRLNEHAIGTGERLIIRALMQRPAAPRRWR